MERAPRRWLLPWPWLYPPFCCGCLARGIPQESLELMCIQKRLTFHKSETFNHVSFHMVIKNRGQTPAFKLRHRVTISLDTIPPTNIPSFTLPQNGTSIAPGGQFESHADKVFTDEEVMSICGGDLSIYVTGTIHYADAFGHPRFTNHRSVYGTGGLPLPTTDTQIVEDHNIIPQARSHRRR